MRCVEPNFAYTPELRPQPTPAEQGTSGPRGRACARHGRTGLLVLFVVRNSGTLARCFRDPAPSSDTRLVQDQGNQGHHVQHIHGTVGVEVDSRDEAILSEGWIHFLTQDQVDCENHVEHVNIAVAGGIPGAFGWAVGR
eukprot:scaffold357_cov400-Prasinococcus_capsulatus_cf.AAC.9